MMSFLTWWPKRASLRDVVVWCEFLTRASEVMPVEEAVYHGACLVFLDIAEAPLKTAATAFLRAQLSLDATDQMQTELTLVDTEDAFGIPPFLLRKLGDAQPVSYAFDAPSVQENLFRIARALKTSKPIMLEGAPGVGKTSIVEALGRYTGRRVTRVNLSEETDLIDLLGCDLP
jgi:midasin